MLSDCFSIIVCLANVTIKTNVVILNFVSTFYCTAHIMHILVFCQSDDWPNAQTNTLCLKKVPTF